MKKGVCRVVGAGDFTPELLKREEGDIVIACDGGYGYLRSFGIPCDICVGDFDSLGYTPDFSNIVRLPKEKDVTDMEAGIRLGMEQGYDSFVMYGALGGRRLSHTIANIQSALGIVKKGMTCNIVDENCDIAILCDEEREFENKGYSYVSVFALEGEARVTLCGFKYDGEEIILTEGYPLGVSNEFCKKKGKITARGKIAIIFEKN